MMPTVQKTADTLSQYQHVAIRVFTRPYIGPEAHAEYYAFDLANQKILIDRPFRIVEPFASSYDRNAFAPVRLDAHHIIEGCDFPIKHMMGHLDNQWHRISLRCSGDVYTINVGNLGCFFVDRQASIIRWLDPRKNLDPDVLSQMLIGPPLLILAAFQQTWFLHASSAQFGDKLAAFVGKSGRGKSTMAAFLDSRLNWKRVCDDMLPISREKRGVTAWPHFPQYKLPIDRQPGLNHPACLLLNAIYILEPSNSDTHSVEISSASPIMAATIIMGQTAGAKLFDPTLLREHFAFGTYVVERLPVRILRYPRQFDCLPAVAEALEEDLTQQI